MGQNKQNGARVGYRDGENVIVHQSWKNQIGTLVVFVLLLAATTYLTVLYPDFTTVPLDFGAREVDFPLLNVLPLILLCRAAYAIYNERFVLTPDYLIHVTGRLAWRGRSSRLDYSKIQEIEIEETILQRVLGVGDLKIIPTAGTEANSIRLQGVSSPRGLKDLIRERTNQREIAE